MTAKDLKNALLQEAVQGKLVPPACRQAGKLQAKIPSAKDGQWFVYVIECEDGSFYKGFTTDLQKRYEQHCNGTGADWTKTHKPKQLYYWEIHYSEESALQREKYLKSGVGREWFKNEVVDKPENWSSARDLLEEIRKEKAKLVKEGKLKKEKPFEEIKEDEISFDIPANWCWCRLGDAIDVRDGTHDTPAYIQRGYPLITSKDFRGDHFDLSKTKYISKQDYDLINQRSKVEIGDILFSMIGGNIGNKILITTENYFEMAIKNVALFKNNTNVYNLYLFYVLEYYTKEFQNYSVGGAQTFVSLNFIRNYPFPLPPLAEQKRIVAAIEKFLPLIEEYGKKETELNAFNEQIGTLTKKAILQEAVQGKLVPQIAAEGNAKDLLEEIKKERLSHGFANSYGICDEKNKKSKSSDLRSKSQIRVTKKELPEITEDEIPFDIPESWCWCRLGEIVDFGKCENAEPDEINADDWILDLEDIEKDSGRILAFKTKKDVESKSTKHIFKEGYVLYSKLRPYLNKCVVAPKNGFCTSEILPLDFGKLVYNRYAQLYLMSPFFVDYTTSLSFGVKMPRLGTEDGKKALFPLPPLAEQKRIVEAMENLLPLCEALKI